LFIAKSKLGPVHINVPFEEPLYETEEKVAIQPVLVELFSEEKEAVDLTEFVEIWNKSTKKLVLLGGNYSKAIQQEYLNQLGEDNSVVVMTEVTSNAHHHNFITNIDTQITPFTEEEFLDFQPEILVTIGGMIVSKRIKAFLRKYKPKHHWHIDKLRAYNTFDCLTQHFQMLPNVFFAKFLLKTEIIESDFLKKALKIRNYRTIKHQEYIDIAPFSDLKVFETILSKLPANIQLQISNSSPIRYAQLFAIDKNIEVFCNRGTSGIDGSTTTAIGASVVNNKPTIFITGDISFFYDSNALWNNYIPNNFKIILINNSGGGIFRILPGHQETETFTKYFETSHSLSAKYLAEMYQFKYITATNLLDIQTNWDSFVSYNQPAILEIFTPEKSNNEVLLEYFNNLK